MGFFGVVLVIQPRADEFNAWALVCLFGTLFHAARDLLTRRIPAGIPSILITLSTCIAVTLMSGVISVFEGWHAFGVYDLLMLGLAAAFLSGGYYFIINSMRYIFVHCMWFHNLILLSTIYVRVCTQI